VAKKRLKGSRERPPTRQAKNANGGQGGGVKWEVELAIRGGERRKWRRFPNESVILEHHRVGARG
jgi:hypothetical protein